MTVKTHVPWPLRIAALAIGVILVTSGGYWLYQSGKSFAGFGKNLKDEVARLETENTQLQADNKRLTARADAAEGRLFIETSTQAQLGQQIRSLEMENAKLKDDVAFFDNLSTAQAPTAEVSIKRFLVQPDEVVGQLHYRMLVTQGGSADHAFAGELQLILTLQRQGKTAIMNLPDPAVPAEVRAFQVNFRFFKRLEGTFAVPPGAVVTQVQARILEHGIVRSQQSVAVN